jgi:hypothetical protein
MAKGKLAFGFGATHSATAEIKARWLDIDALLGPGGKKEPTPAGLLGKLAGLGLAQAARFDRSALQLKVDQASLGGDLVTDVDLDLKGNKREIEIDKLIAGLPGDSHIDTHGKLTEQGGAPQFDGAVKLGGAKLRTVTRWALGDRELAGQASSGAFSLAANVSIAPADIQLANVKGALSGTSFSGALRYHDGERPSLYATLDSNRLDLRDLIGEPGSWSLWSKTSPGSGEKRTTGTRQGLIAALGKTEMHVALRVGKLLLPKTQGALDANFAYANGNLSIGKLDFKSPGAISLNGSGEIDQLVSSSASGSASASAPSGQVNFALSGQKPESLAFLAKLLGLPDTVADKDYLAQLAPLDLHVALKADHAANKPELTADISGKAKAADIAVKASIAGDLSKLADADITLHGGITGAPPQVLLPILFPGTADAALTARLAQASGEESNFNLALSGVPAKSMTGSATLSGPLTISVNGQGALQNDALTMHARLGAKTADAGLLVGLTGLKVSPAARAVPLDLNGTLTSKTGEIALSSISGTVGQQHVAGSIRLLRHKKQKPELFLDLSGDTVSLPGLLGTLIAWDRSPSTEAILGTLTQGASAVWPVRGFALDPLADANSHINVKAKTLLLGSAFPLTDASLEADADESGLKVRSLDGELFDGTFTASGKLVPRGAGAHFEGQAKLSKAELVPALTAIAGKPLASSRFDLRFNLAGDGLSPAGLVAGLSGGGLLTLSKGRIQSLNADALRRMVAGAARADKNAVNEERVTALGKALRKQIFSGSFPFAATSIAFDIANGTVRVDHAALVNREATAGIEGYLALASLKLDSEWKLQLNAKAASDIPPVGLVLAGPLDQPGGVIATVDSKPVESYFTVERMQQDVERLENLDVTGQGDGADQAAPSRQSTNGSGAVNSPPPIPQRAPGYPGTSQQSASGGRVLTDPQPRRTVRPRPPPQPHNDWRNGFGLFGGG